MIFKDMVAMMGLDCTYDATDKPNLSNSFICKNVYKDRSKRAIDALYSGREDLFMIFQQEQGGTFETMMSSREYVYIFIGKESSNAVFYACLKKTKQITAAEARKEDLLTKEYEEKIVEGKIHDDSVFYIYEKIPTPGQLENRLVIKFDTNLAYCVKPSTLFDKKVIEILPEKSSKHFTSYDEVYLNYNELTEVIKDDTWKDALSRYGGVYLIKDENTQKMYVGSAYGKNGIYGRWSNYANYPTGGDEEHGNKKLVELINREGIDYVKQYFRYSILEVIPLTKSGLNILKAETLWKRKLGTRNDSIGLNDN